MGPLDGCHDLSMVGLGEGIDDGSPLVVTVGTDDGRADGILLVRREGCNDGLKEGPDDGVIEELGCDEANIEGCTE